MQEPTKQQALRAKRITELTNSTTLFQTARKLTEQWYNQQNADDYNDKDLLVQETEDIASILELIALLQTENEVQELTKEL